MKSTLVAAVVLFLFVAYSAATDNCELQIEAGKKKHHGCDKFLAGFASKDSLFSQCMINNAAPFSICGECISHYNNFTIAYNLLKSSETCVKCYFNKDKMNLIENMFLNLENLWEKAFCSECTETKSISEEMDSVNTCIRESETKNTDACKNCQENYQKAMADYKVLNETKEKICFDLQDKMNRTAIKWSDLKCKSKPIPIPTPSSNVLIISSSAFVFVCAFCGGFTVYAIRRRNNNLETLNTDSENPTRRPNTVTRLPPSNDYQQLIEDGYQPLIEDEEQPALTNDIKKVLKYDSKNFIDSDDDSIDNEDDISTVASISRSKLDEMEPVLRSSFSSIDTQSTAKIDEEIDKKIK